MERFSKATPRERRSYLLQRYESLKNVRGHYMPMWKELVKYMAPFYGCFSPDEKLGQRTMKYIFDHHAEHCINTLVGGLSSYATSPALPWFRLVANDDSFKYDQLCSPLSLTYCADLTLTTACTNCMLICASLVLLRLSLLKTPCV